MRSIINESVSKVEAKANELESKYTQQLEVQAGKINKETEDTAVMITKMELSRTNADTEVVRDQKYWQNCELT